MNERAKHYLREMRGDGRNPYGSRGGYVTSRDPRHRRDRGEYDEPYMDYPRERDARHNRREYEQEPYAKMRGNFEYDRYDYGDDYDYDDDMRGRRGGRDYDDDMDDKLTKQEMKEWEKDLVNDDGSRGAHFTDEQIDQAARSIGIEPKEFGDGVLCVITNSMYADYCSAARKFGVDRIEFYIELAKAFLKDKDFDGDGAEKAFLYYTFIVSQDDK